jgi:gamma-glutamylcyclotransferase (GGCT)/AIG2-like uncharacterized protein YtfP
MYMLNKLFVYGTLKSQTGRMKELAGKYRFQFVGTGSIMAKAIQATYPAVVPSQMGERIHGELILLQDTASLLTILDAYEAFDASHPESSLYLRAVVSVRMDQGPEETAWVYFYNGPEAGEIGS